MAKGRKSRKGRRSTIMSRKTRRRMNRAKHRALMKKTRKWSKKARSRYATGGDYITMKSYRSANYGPVPFALQPAWVRKLGRKQGRRRRSR